MFLSRHSHIKGATFDSAAAPVQGDRVQFQLYESHLGSRRLQPETGGRVTCGFKTSSITRVQSAARRSLLLWSTLIQPIAKGSSTHIDVWIAAVKTTSHRRRPGKLPQAA